MANFRTHVLGAAAVSSLAAYAAFSGGLVDSRGALLAAACGTLGGILPDIDADQSRPTRLIFTALGLAAAAATVFALKGERPPALVAITAIVAALVVAVGLRGLTDRLSVHRGLIHSLPVAALSGAATALIAAEVGADPLRSWLFGAFVTAGFLVHLLLDELYSVDLLNTRLKRSFGSALKLGLRRTPLLCALTCAAVALIVSLGPPVQPLLQALQSPRTLRAVSSAFGG